MKKQLIYLTIIAALCLLLLEGIHFIINPQTWQMEMLATAIYLTIGTWLMLKLVNYFNDRANKRKQW